MNKLAEIIRAEIASGGVMPFARFMELALYCPQLGYYERKKDTVGRAGDFYTSVSTGPLFGELLAFRFAGWLASARPGAPKLRLIEAGAHDGQLARDILQWFHARRPDLFPQLEYLILEPSPVRQGWQQQTLQAFAPSVRWLADLAGLPADAASPAILFGNELLDAMPVQRLGWDAVRQTWFEWGVDAADGGFVWARLELSPSRHPLPAAPELWAALPDGYTVETSPAAASWWRAAAAHSAIGRLVAIDYGYLAADLFRPENPAGTLRAYRHHRVTTDLLAEPGLGDLTAHVDFSAIQQAGESAGLKTCGLFSQAQFLTQIAGEAWQQPAVFGEWTAARTRQFQTLTHPEHLGRAFRVLVQTK